MSLSPKSEGFEGSGRDKGFGHFGMLVVSVTPGFSRDVAENCALLCY